MSETMITLIGVPVMMLVIASLLVGFVTICSSIWGSTGWGVRRAKAKKNALPDTVMDTTIRALLGLIHSEPEGWVTFIKESSNYYESKERIKRLDGKVVISNYNNADSIKLTLDGIGDIKTNDIKPELVDKLVETCSTFKVLVATHALLKPDTIVTHELT